MNANVVKDYMTTQEVADHHGVSRGCVMHWITDGSLAATKVSKIWLVKTVDAKAYKRKPIPGRPKKS